MSKNRTLASLISNDTSKVKQTYIDSDAIVTSASLGVTVAAGTTTYSSVDTLPVLADNGDQALVTSTNRLYIYTNSGWYNIALINSTPYWSSEASSSYSLSTTGTSTIITILAVDSEGVPITYTTTTDSDFDGIATITKDSDNGRIFTVTPIDSENGTALAGTGTVTFKASDGVNLVSTLSTFSISFKVQYSNYTTFLAKADTGSNDNQVDASSNSNTITEVGTVDSTALSPYHPGGYSTYFDGVSDYLSFTMTSAFNLTGDFTLECWFKPNSITLDTQHPSIIILGSYQLYVNSSSNFVGISPDGLSITLQSANSSIALNTWYHVAVVRSGSSEAMFLNGTRVDTNTASTVYGASSGTSLIGSYNGTGGDYNGAIRDLRLVNGTAIYNPSETTISTPTEPLTAVANTSLLTCHLPYIADGSSNNNTITVNGNTSTKRFGPYDYEGYTKTDHGGSVYVGGATSYVSTNLPAMNGDWTIEGWIQHTANTGTSSQNRIFGGATNDPMILNTGLTSLNVYIDNNLKITANAAANAAAGLDQWYHMALVRETTGNILKLYINGKLAGSQSSGTYDIDAKDPFGIGSDANNSAYGMTGYIADFRVVNGTAVYTAEFTPPTAPLTEITNTDLLTCTNKNDIWDTGSGARVSKVGNATSSNTQRKFTTSSAIYFDGTGDYLSGNDMGLGGANAFTIEAWMYPTVYNTYANDMYSHGANLSVGADFLAFGIKPDGNVQMFKGSGSPALLSTSAPCTSLNQWYHIAFVRESNNNTSAYVNGVLVAGPTAISGALTYAPTGRAFIGTQSYSAGASDRSFEGYIQDVRITNGLARYTSNFTPPTTEFTG